MSIKIARYSSDLRGDWDAVLASSKNGIFQFDRNFIEYHGSRFTDYSMIVYCDDRPTAIFPAAISADGSKIISHPGITFGGFVLRRDVWSKDSFCIVDGVLDRLKCDGFREVYIKLLPTLFTNYPSSEIDYALWRRGFALFRRDLSSVLPTENPLPPSKLRRRQALKAEKAGVSLSSTGIEAFHLILSATLRERHAVDPVHTLDELKLLQATFPNKILLRVANRCGATLAGSLLFLYERVWHTQYLATSEEGRKLGALDFVIGKIIDEARNRGAEYISFGASTTDNGKQLNEGLLWQKESFGARAIVHDFVQGAL